MLSNLALSSIRPQTIVAPSPRRKSPNRCLQVTQSKNILTVNNNRNSPPELPPADAGTQTIHKTFSKPMYVDDRDDETVSVLSDVDGLLLNTHFEYDENENSGPSCSFGSASLQQQYMGGNYFFRQNSFEPEIDYLDIIVSFPSEDQSYQECSPKENRDQSNALSRMSSRDSKKIEGRNSSDCDDLHRLIETLRKEKFALSQKCSKLETLIDKARMDHNCYKIQMTMAMGNMRVQMESERDDKAYLLEKCQQLTSELSKLRIGLDSKLEKISILEQELRNVSKPMKQQEEEKDILYFISHI